MKAHLHLVDASSCASVGAGGPPIVLSYLLCLGACLLGQQLRKQAGKHASKQVSKQAQQASKHVSKQVITAASEYIGK